MSRTQGMLREARRRAGLTQRQLARVARVPQSTIARIESGVMDPKTSTLRKLLRACGSDLESLPTLGEGVDRTLIRSTLERSLLDRFRATANMARFVNQLRESRRSGS